jgi:hypothetical protein
MQGMCATAGTMMAAFTNVVEYMKAGTMPQLQLSAGTHILQKSYLF